jgi:hypothetical protein
MFLQNFVKYVNNMNAKTDEYIEIELKVLLDPRIKLPYFTSKFLDTNFIPYIKNLYKKALFENIEMEQTINFIHNGANNTFVKQLHYDKGIQIPSKKHYYTKKQLCKPSFLISDSLPPYKLCLNLETTELNDINNFDIVRFRLRFMIKIPELNNWRLDITMIKECKNQPVETLKKIRNRIFNPKINKENIIDLAEWDYYDKIEVETEYTGDSRNFREIDIKNVDMLFETEKYANKTFKECICDIARLIKPKKLDKFKNGEYGLKQLGSNPIEITKRFYQTELLENIHKYYITEKIDGIRTMLVLYPDIGQCYAINNSTSECMTMIKIPIDPSIKLIILDSELANGKYYVFDIIYIGGKKNIEVYKMPFTKRLIYINEIVDIYDFLCNKNFQELTDYSNQIRSFYERMLIQEYKIDGLIIFSKNDSYINTKQYKWKPVMTIDFVVKKCPKTMLGIKPFIKKSDCVLYLLFCGIKKSEYKKLGVEKFKNYNQIFTNICSNRYGSINEDYYPIQFSPSADPHAYLFWCNRTDLDEKIVELTYVNNEWKFIKIRDDRASDMARKTYYGNYFKYAENIWMNFKDPLTMDILCQSAEISRSNTYFQINSVDYNAMRKFNNFVKNKTINLFPENSSFKWVVDLASGKGQDLYKYIEAGYKNILMVDNDNDALTEIINRKYMYIYQKNTMKNISKIFIHKANLQDDNKIIVKKINSFGIQQNGVDLVVCNLAIHYIIPDKPSIQNFCEIVHEILAYKGIFIFTAFDSKKIFKLLKKTGEWNIKDDSNKILYSIKKKYNSCEFTGINQQIDVLMPFSNGKYYTENLINIQLLNKTLLSKKIKLIKSGSFDSYLQEFSDEKNKLYKQLTNVDKEYVSLYSFYIYRNMDKK